MPPRKGQRVPLGASLSLESPHALGLRDLSLPLAPAEEHPCCCLTIGKLRHRRIVAQHCPSRDGSATSGQRLLGKPLCSSLLLPASLLRPRPAPSWHFGPGPAPSCSIRIGPSAGSSPCPEGAGLLSPSGTEAPGSSPRLRGGPASSLCSCPCPTASPPALLPEVSPREAGTPRPSKRQWATAHSVTNSRVALLKLEVRVLAVGGLHAPAPLLLPFPAQQQRLPQEGGL